MPCTLGGIARSLALALVPCPLSLGIRTVALYCIAPHTLFPLAALPSPIKLSQASQTPLPVVQIGRGPASRGCRPSYSSHTREVEWSLLSGSVPPSENEVDASYRNICSCLQQPASSKGRPESPVNESPDSQSTSRELLKVCDVWKFNILGNNRHVPSQGFSGHIFPRVLHSTHCFSGSQILDLALQ